MGSFLHTDADGNSGPLSACNLNNCSKGAPASVTTCVPTTVGIVSSRVIAHTPPEWQDID